jgi:hypothetical protein
MGRLIRVRLLRTGCHAGLRRDVDGGKWEQWPALSADDAGSTDRSSEPEIERIGADVRAMPQVREANYRADVLGVCRRDRVRPRPGRTRSVMVVSVCS